jgi:hypothetical protein
MNQALEPSDRDSVRKKQLRFCHKDVSIIRLLFQHIKIHWKYSLARRLRQQHAAGTAAPEDLAKFRGRLAYLWMLNPEQATRIGPVP